MIKLVALWTEPSDVEDFEAHYKAVHLPLLEPLPGLVKVVASKAVSGPYHRMAELHFASMEALSEGMGSDVSTNLMADTQQLTEKHGNRCDVLIVETDDE